MSNRVVFTFLLAAVCIANLAYSKELFFNANGEFTILQMTDLHYGESEAADNNNMMIQDKLIKRVKPDLVAVTGDVVAGEAYDKKKKNFTKKIWEKFYKPFSDNKTPYAFAIGNRDVDGDLKGDGIFKLEQSYKDYSILGMSKGWRIYERFNYNIPVYSSLKKDEIPLNLWVFNTNKWGCLNDKQSPGCVDKRQIEWFQRRFAEFSKFPGNKNAYNIAFLHIPIYEFMNLYNDHEYYGTRNEEVGSPTLNTGLFQELKKANFHAIFVGHDHLNDFGGYIDGIELVYGRKTGYGGYSWHDPNYQRGARVIKLKEKQGENGVITVEYQHHVIVENPEYNNGKEEDLTLQKALHRRHNPKQDPFAYPHDKSKEMGSTTSVRDVADKMKGHFGLLIGLLVTVGVLGVAARLFYMRYLTKYQGYGKLKFKAPGSYEMSDVSSHMA